MRVPLSQSLRHARHLLLAAAASLAIAACGRNVHADTAGAPPVLPAGWQTICVGHLLIDLPPMVEMVAENATYDGGAGFPSVQPPDFVYDMGLQSGSLKITESEPTDETAFRLIQSTSEGRFALAMGHDRYEAKEAPQEIVHWKQNAQSQRPGETAWQILADKQREFDDTLFSIKVSGKSTPSVANAFAYRHGKQFEAGYLDAADHRIRRLVGDIVSPQTETPKEAARQLNLFLARYKPRTANQIPTGPGLCTPHGFIAESGQSEGRVNVSVTFRSLQYPNLIFMLDTATANTSRRRNIRDLPKMGFDESGIFYDRRTDRFGPKPVDILGSPGRILGSTTPQPCKGRSTDDCDPPEDIYRLQAATFGQVGRLDSPYLLLNMAAVVPDDYKLKRDPARAEDPDARKEYITQRRAGLNGHQPPPWKEGIAMFEQIVCSIRVRPGGIAGSSYVDMPSPIPSDAPPAANHAQSAPSKP